MIEQSSVTVAEVVFLRSGIFSGCWECLLGEFVVHTTSKKPPARGLLDRAALLSATTTTFGAPLGAMMRSARTCLEIVYTDRIAGSVFWKDSFTPRPPVGYCSKPANRFPTGGARNRPPPLHDRCSITHCSEDVLLLLSWDHAVAESSYIATSRVAIRI